MSGLQDLETGIWYSENGTITYYENQEFAKAFKDIMDQIHSERCGWTIMRAHIMDNVIPEFEEVRKWYLARINDLALTHWVENKDEIDWMILANMRRRTLLSI